MIHWSRASGDLWKFEFELSLPGRPDHMGPLGRYNGPSGWKINWDWGPEPDNPVAIEVSTSVKLIGFPLYEGSHNYQGICVSRGKESVDLIVKEFLVWLPVVGPLRRHLSDVDPREHSLEEEFFGRVR